MTSGCNNATETSGPLTEPRASPAATSPDASPSIVDSKDWPRLYGPSGDCVAGSESIGLNWTTTPPRVLWNVPVGSGYSAPVVRDEMLIVQHRIDNQQHLTCLSTESGEQLWQSSLPTQFECSYPNYSSGPYSTPVIGGNDVVYALSAEGILQAVSIHDGRELWRRNLSQEMNVPSSGYSVGHSPLLDQGKLIVNVGGSLPETGVLALDPNSGDTLWSSVTIPKKDHSGSHGTPVAATIHGQRLIFVLLPHEFACLRATSGQVLWSIPFSTESRDTPNSTTPVVSDDLVFVSMFRAGAMCLRIHEDGHYTELWNNRRSLETCYNPVTCLNGRLYGWHSFDRTFRCIDLHTGEVLGKTRTNLARGNHIAFANAFLVLGEQGHLGFIDPQSSSKPVAFTMNEPTLEGPCYTMPAYSLGHLYVRNESQLACVRVPLMSQRSNLQ